ncbi:MAG: hypothetical protein KAG92_01285, partial [Deltaproteobacteria bacterium]|nr:hypothetical protein [Deltaproteobacteria bacterium]
MGSILTSPGRLAIKSGEDMKNGLRTWLKSSGIFCLLTASLLVIIPPSIVLAQLPVDPAETEQRLEHLQLLLSKARQSLSSSQLVLEMTPAEQLGATPEEIEEKKLLLSTRVFHYSNYIASLRNREETRRSNEDLAAKSEAWQGFDQAAPYPIDLVDELRDSIHAQSLAIAKNKVNKTLIDQQLEDARKALVFSEKELRLKKESSENSLLGADRIRTNWLNDLGELNKEVAQTKVLASQARLQEITASISLHKKQEIFLERQLQVAAQNTLFSAEDLEQKLALLTEKLKAVTDKEKQQLTRNNHRDQENLYQARSQLLQAREALVQEDGDPEEKTEEINYLQQVVETRKAQADSSAQL